MKIFKKQENYVIEYSSIKKDQLVSEDEVVDRTENIFVSVVDY